MNIFDGLCYDDVLLIPQYSKIHSRADIDLSVDLGKDIKLQGPIISANMKTISGPRLAGKMFQWGMGLLHRFDTIENQIKNYNTAITVNKEQREELRQTVGVSVGIFSESDNDKLIRMTNTRIVCIDVAHADHKRVLHETERLAKKFPEVLLIVGNVSTAGAAKRLSNAGADVVKCGQGSGALCSTRIETGNGVPQLTALEYCYNELKNTNTKLIADGGIKRAGDCVKALCFSHAIMLGSMISGTDETPGEIVELDGHKYKQYAGSSTHKTNRIEGVAGLVKYKGPLNNVMQTIIEGIQSGLSYQGCKTLDELRESPVFVRITNAGLIESHPHAVLK